MGCCFVFLTTTQMLSVIWYRDWSFLQSSTPTLALVSQPFFHLDIESVTS